MDGTEVGLVAASALHAGFQLVVTLVVYPAFADAPEGCCSPIGCGC